MAETPIGKVTHYFDKIGVAVVNIKAPLSKGDTLHFKGDKTDFTQEVSSMQVDHTDVESVKPGEDFGLKVSEEVKEGDEVFKV